MTRTARGWGGTLFLLALPASGLAQQLPGPERYHLRVEYREWRPSLDAQIQKGFGTAEGTLLDVTNDLGVPDTRTWEVDATLKLSPGIKLRGSITPLDYAGDTPAAFTFDFGDTTYYRGDRVVTTLKGHYYTGALEWDFLKRSEGFLGAFLGAKVFDVDAVVLDADQNRRVVETGRLPIPVLGIIGRYYAGHLSLEGEFSGLTIGSRGHLWELDASARLHLSDRLAVQGGYRRISLEGKDQRDFVSFRLAGFTFGAELSL
jgi:hypothetical protein